MLAESAIVKAIMRFAAQCGDSAPASIRYVFGTRGDLNKFASGAEFSGADWTTPAVLVEATGHFAWRRRGLAAPGTSPYRTGRAISLGHVSLSHVLLRVAQNEAGCVVVLGGMNQIRPSSSALPASPWIAARNGQQ